MASWVCLFIIPCLCMFWIRLWQRILNRAMHQTFTAGNLASCSICHLFFFIRPFLNGFKAVFGKR